MRTIALIDDVDVVERILRNLDQWDPQPDTLTPAGPDPPLPQGETAGSAAKSCSKYVWSMERPPIQP
jgi:hypothetical protein